MAAVSGDASALVEQLVARHGSVGEAARAIGADPSSLAKLRDGRRQATPATLKRLRAALDAPPPAPPPPRRVWARVVGLWHERHERKAREG